MTRIIGALRAADGAGVVTMEDRFDTDINDLWSSITDPQRLARWYGKVDGDLRPGGTFSLFVDASGWEGTGRIDVCGPPNRLVVTSRQSAASWQPGETPYSEVIDATLTAHGEQTVLTIEVHGLPLDKVGYYGAGWQQNVETLAAYLAGKPPVSEERFEELVPTYLDLAAKL